MQGVQQTKVVSPKSISQTLSPTDVIKHFVSQELASCPEDNKYAVYFAVKTALENFSSEEFDITHTNPIINGIFTKILNAPVLLNAFKALAIPTKVSCVTTHNTELLTYLSELEAEMSASSTSAMSRHMDKVKNTIIPIGNGKGKKRTPTVLSWGVCYMSKWGDHTKNANNKVSVPYGEISCRQLSWETLVSGAKPLKSYHTAMRDLQVAQSESLRRNFYDTKNIRFRANEYYFLHKDDDIGDILYDIAKDLGVDSIKSMLFITSSHQISFTIEHKESGNIVLKWYDPNRTECHIRFLTDKVEKLKLAKLDDFMEKQQQADYFSRLSSTTVAVYVDPKRPVGDGSQPHQFTVAHPTKLSPAEILAYTTVYNADNLIELLKNTVAAESDGDKLFGLLANDLSDPGKPLFFTAVLAPRENFVVVFISVVAKSTLLTSKQKILLLKATATIQGRAYSVLFLGINSGRASEITNYTREILKSTELSDDEKVAILSDDGFNGDQSKRSPAHDEPSKLALIAFANEVRSSTLPEDKKTLILKTQRYKID